MAISLLVFLVMFIQGASADTILLRDRLESTNQKISQRQELAENIAKLEQRIAEVEVSRDNFTTVLGSLEKQRNGVSDNLKVTVDSLPSTMSLSSISYANNILIITGKAPSKNEILLYLSKLDASSRFGEFTITNMSRINDEGMGFTLLGSPEKQSTGVSSIEVALNSLPTTISLTR
ncbi:unnamed protein product, partial [marine sediment metagenome]